MLYCSACRGAILYTGRQAKVAQLVEHSTENAGVVGSIPSLGTFYWFWKRAVSLKPLLAGFQVCHAFNHHRLVQQPPQA